MRGHYLSTRDGHTDKAPLTAFLEEFVTTQMFESFSGVRDARGQILASRKDLTNLPFFQCALTISSMRLHFDRVS